MEIPVYLFSGFLDAGKTKFIQETLEDPKFYTDERTLVILCEEGEEEYDSTKYPSDAVFFHTVEDISEFSPKFFLSLQKKYRMNRVIIEYNGMWLLENLFTSLPENWVVYQEITFADASTIVSYNNNMRNLVADKILNCDMIVFNRVKIGEDIMQYHKLVRNLSRRANITYEYTDGEIQYDDIEDPLPFDLEADIINIEDVDYALWYRDIVEEPDKYDGKTVRFKAFAVKNDKLPANSLLTGRYVMTCCEDDITFGGLLANYENANDFETRDWIWITAKISVEYSPIYESKGPVLYATDIEHTITPKQELATFY